MTRNNESEVLIVGGGLAGLTLANYLARQGQEPLIVEQASDWRESGYGIGLWDDGLAVIDELGHLEAVREHAADPDGFEVRSSEGGLLTRTAIAPEQTLLLAIYRGDLHATLREAVPDDWIRMGTSPERIDERSDEVVVTFDDGTTATFGLVVGADGVHSTVREQCFTSWTLREHDTYIWSLWAAQDIDVGSDMVSVWGPGSEGFVTRVGNRIGFNLAARLDEPPEPPAREILRGQAETIGWKLPELLAETEDEPFFDRVRDVKSVVPPLSPLEAVESAPSIVMIPVYIAVALGVSLGAVIPFSLVCWIDETQAELFAISKIGISQYRSVLEEVKEESKAGLLRKIRIRIQYPPEVLIFWIARKRGFGDT